MKYRISGSAVQEHKRLKTDPALSLDECPCRGSGGRRERKDSRNQGAEGAEEQRLHGGDLEIRV